jgi:hypothetical protein
MAVPARNGTGGRKALAFLVLADVRDRVADGGDLLGRIVGDLDAELFLEGHHQLDDVETVGAQIVDEARLFGDLLLLDAVKLASGFTSPASTPRWSTTSAATRWVISSWLAIVPVFLCEWGSDFVSTHLECHRCRCKGCRKHRCNDYACEKSKLAYCTVLKYAKNSLRSSAFSRVWRSSSGTAAITSLRASAAVSGALRASSGSAWN